jgi:hypothetical protein
LNNLFFGALTEPYFAYTVLLGDIDRSSEYILKFCEVATFFNLTSAIMDDLKIEIILIKTDFFCMYNMRLVIERTIRDSDNH